MRRGNCGFVLVQVPGFGCRPSAAASGRSRHHFRYTDRLAPVGALEDDHEMKTHRYPYQDDHSATPGSAADRDQLL